jgi:hypothetical protein
MAYDRFIIRECLWIVTEPVNIPVYDFDFRQFFECRTPYQPPLRLAGVARVGAFADYEELFDDCVRLGIDLIHSPAEHIRCSTLPAWYPLISDYTPRSRWYSKIPDFTEIENEFELPIFIKGSRQTSRHTVASIVRSQTEYIAATQIFRSDPILSWQEFVCREFVPLRPISGGIEGKVPASFEFRTFWWRGELVGAGPYWYEANKYKWTQEERKGALEVARQVVEKLKCNFLVIDLAQTVTGKWIIIECNDGMESGYAGASPFAIWQAITDLENKCRKEM